eukprot:5607896-Heterocapsa_arctica.AAC.1
MDDFDDPRGRSGSVPVPVRVVQGQQLRHLPPLFAVRISGIIRQFPERIPPEGQSVKRCLRD